MPLACADSPTAPGLSVPFSSSDLVVGVGAEAIAGHAVTIEYTGWLYNSTAPQNKGRQFDTTLGRGPLSFVLGAGQVIRGWDRGIGGMKVGGRRRLVVPPDLAYGSMGAGDGLVPPNATLVFEIDLVGVE